jgi:hypothetical protein
VRPSHKAVRQTGADLRRLLHLALQRSLSFTLWYRSGKEACRFERTFVLISYLLVIKEWWDPDSNRGHYDFQLCD